jgi:hypothetical protein
MQDRINQLIEEKTKLEEELFKLKEHRDTEMEKRIQQLQKQKAGLEKEVEFLHHREIHLQKEVDKTGRDGHSKDMAMVFKRYYKMEEQFGQVTKKIKRDVETVLAEKERRIVQQVQENLVITVLAEKETKIVQQVQETLWRMRKIYRNSSRYVLSKVRILFDDKSKDAIAIMK